MARKALSFLLTLCLLLSITMIANASSNSSDGAGEIVKDERLIREGLANKQYDSMIRAMEKKYEDEFPEYYGGAFVNENGDLVVCKVSENEDSEKEIVEMTNNPKIITRTVKYSYNDLYTVYSEISQAMSDFNEGKRSEKILGDIKCTKTCETDNTVIVEIEGLNDDKVKEFKELFPEADCVSFANWVGYTTFATAWKPGSGVYTSSGARASTGYPVYFTDTDGLQKKGFITAGHAYSANASVYKSSTINNTNKLGVCKASQLSGNVDAALIKITNSNYTMSSTTMYNGYTLSTTAYTIPAEGSTVLKEGSTTQNQSGMVMSTNSSIAVNGLTLSNMIETTAYGLPGDSGGPFYCYTGSSYNIVGSLSCATFTTNNPDLYSYATFKRTYATKVSNALNSFGCTIWP